MSAEEARAWLGYAQENLQVAAMALEAGLLNPSLQNAQQAVEKSLKAVWIGRGSPLRKTHSIADLVEDLAATNLNAGLSTEECDLFDSIYLPSKYPVASVLPVGMPTAVIAERCLDIARAVCAWSAGQV